MEPIRATRINLEKRNDPETALKKPFGTASFCHYTTAKAMNNILDTNKIWASRLTKTNDKNDSYHNTQKGRSLYCLCFCNSNTEKIPLWYLYAGVSGNGMRMRLTPARMRDFVHRINEVFPVDKSEKADEKTVLLKNRDFTLTYGWVYYVKNNSSYDLKHRGQWFYFETKNEYDSFKEENCFIKDYPWEYEKEFRIVFDFSLYRENHGDLDFDRIAIPLNIEDLKLMFAPEAVCTDEVLSMPGLRKCAKQQFESSQLNVSMGLVGKDIDGMISALKAAVDKSDKKKQYLDIIKKTFE